MHTYWADDTEKLKDAVITTPTAQNEGGWPRSCQNRIAQIVGGSEFPMATVEVSGTIKECCLIYLPEAAIGDYVIIHAGFAVSILDEREALASLALSIVAGYAFVSYVIYALSGTVSGLRPLRPLMIWRWYLLNDPLANGPGWPEIIALTVVCLAALSCGAYFFGRRDLRA